MIRELPFRSHALWQVEVFADAPLQGSPLAVLFDCDDLSPQERDAIARETGLPATVFLMAPQASGTVGAVVHGAQKPRSGGNAGISVQAAIGAAHALAHRLGDHGPVVTLQGPEGRFRVTRDPATPGGWQVAMPVPDVVPLEPAALETTLGSISGAVLSAARAQAGDGRSRLLVELGQPDLTLPDLTMADLDFDLADMVLYYRNPAPGIAARMKVFGLSAGAALPVCADRACTQAALALVTWLRATAEQPDRQVLEQDLRCGRRARLSVSFAPRRVAVGGSCRVLMTGRMVTGPASASARHQPKPFHPALRPATPTLHAFGA